MERKDELKQVAKNYSKEGYQMILRPGPEQLPDFLANFEPDMIGRKGNQNVVVAVRSREELKGDLTLTHMAGLANSQPGWSFDLVVPNAYPWPERVAEEATELSKDEVTTLLQRAEAFSAAGNVDVAYVLACAALEATLRKTAANLSLSLDDKAASSLLRDVFTEGDLESKEFDHLSRALQVRNAIMHGLSLPHPDPALPGYVTAFVRRLVEQEPALNRSANGAAGD